MDWVDSVKWLADGLKLAGMMLPGLGFAILLHYLPVKRNLHYLALGFGLTAMLTVIYTNLQTVSGTLTDVIKEAGLKTTVFNGAPFKSLPMIGIAIIGGALATLHYKNSQQVTLVEPKAEVSESGKLKMMKSKYTLTKEDFKQINKRSLFTFNGAGITNGCKVLVTFILSCHNCAKCMEMVHLN